MRQDICFEESPYCAVGLSKICSGQGLFALKRFCPGEVVVDYSKTSEKWVAWEFDKLQVVEHHKNSWWVGLTDKLCLLAPPESLFMRANHSKQPNTNWNTTKKQLVAIATIFPGEEITYDYSLEVAPNYIKEKPPEWFTD